MIVIGILILLFVVFLFQNLTPVTVNFFIFEISMPSSLLFIITLTFGLLIGFFLPLELKRQKKNKTDQDSGKLKSEKR
jgi:uncharacterized integral membrane protein